jgi:hypothetical protein
MNSSGRAARLWRIGSAGLLALLLLGRLHPAGADEARYLTVSSQGYSRFEIEGQSVVALYTEGVEFDYLGYHMIADELRYEHLTQRAEATGNINIVMDGYNIYCEAVRIDGQAGELEIPGALTATLSDPPVQLAAGSLLLRFDPGQRVTSMQQIWCSLGGGVEITSEPQSSFSCEALLFDGASSTLTSGGRFSYHGDHGRHALGSALLDLSDLSVSGEDLLATISETNICSQLAAAGVEIVASGLQLRAADLTLDNTSDTEELTSWECTLQGAPVTGLLAQPEDDMGFTAASVHASVDQSGLLGLQLAGDVDCDYAGMHLVAEQLDLERSGDAFSLDMPRGVLAQFDLSKLSGAGQVEAESLGVLLNK